MKAIVLVACLFGPVIASAQGTPELSVHPEVRVDGIFRPDTTAVEAGAGIEIPAGYYTRIGVIAAAGSQYAGGSSAATGRVDVIARFLLDPFRQQAHGLSVGGGLSIRAREHDHVRSYMVVLIDWEGGAGLLGAAPAVQLGLGGGVRIGGALRWGAPKAR